MLYKGKEVPFEMKDFACKCGKCGKGYMQMEDELLDKLFEARRLANVPFIINSAFRCVAHNTAVGGKPDSAHLRGYAVDIRYANSNQKFEMIAALIKVGFTRIGDNVTHSFIHVDCDPSLPQRVFFKY